MTDVYEKLTLGTTLLAVALAISVAVVFYPFTTFVITAILFVIVSLGYSIGHVLLE